MSDIERLLTVIYQQRELLERIFHEREVVIGPEDRHTQDSLQEMKRARVVRVEPDDAGGLVARLSSKVRSLLAMTLRDRKLQQIGVGVQDAMETLSHLVHSWRLAEQRADAELAADIRDEIIDLLDNVELLYEEQLEDIRDRISLSYGFDDRLEQRAQDFAFYLQRLGAMGEGARELDQTLSGEEYQGVEPVEAASLRISRRLRNRGTEIRGLIGELERYLIKLRDQQHQQRNWHYKMRWLRRQQGVIRVDVARAHAGELPITRRAGGWQLDGQPDLGDTTLAREWREVLDRELRWRRDALRQRSYDRVPSGAQRNTPEVEHKARAQAEAERARRWRSNEWVTEFLEAAVRRAKATRENPEAVSAMEFYHERCARAAAGETLPSPRAWLSTVAMLVFANRKMRGEPFDKSFEVRLSPRRSSVERLRPNSGGDVVKDIFVRVRAEALRRRAARAGRAAA